MKNFIIFIFKNFFKVKAFQKHFFGVHQKIFLPFKILEHNKRKLTLKNGLIFHLEIDDWIQENIYFLESYEAIELNYLLQNIAKDTVFIDIGANIGWYSIHLAKHLCQNGKVYSFEPYESNAIQLREHIKLNHLINIEVIVKGISDKNENCKLYLDTKDKNKGMPSTIQANQNEFIEIETCTLDSFLTTLTISKIDFIKIDIEGAELNALRGMTNILKQFKPNILIEIEEELLNKSGVTSKQIFSFLENLSYDSFYIDSTLSLVKGKNNPFSKNYLFKHSDFAN